MTTLRLLANEDATKLFLTSLGGTTGTPTVGGYDLTQVAGKVFDSPDITGLTGPFYAEAKDGDGVVHGVVSRWDAGADYDASIGNVPTADSISQQISEDWESLNHSYDVVQAAIALAAATSVEREDGTLDDLRVSVGTLLTRITANVGTALSNLFSMITGSGAEAAFTEVALANNPAVALTVLPLSGAMTSRTRGTTIEVFTKETASVSVSITDSAGDAVSVEALTLEVVIESMTTGDKVVIMDASISKSSNTLTFAVPAAVSATEATYVYAIRSTANDTVLMQGPFIVTYAAEADS